MDAVGLATATVCGLALGHLALLPGLHTNTLAALAAAVLPASPWLALAFVAMASAQAFTSLIPATYVGVPDDQAVLGVLPAHRMVSLGHGRQAVAVAADATLLATLLAVLLLLPAKWLLVEPLRLGELLAGLAPWLLLALCLLHVAQEWRRRPARTSPATSSAPLRLRRVAWAVVCLLLSAVLALAASRLPFRALVDLPADAFLPILSGLFGAAGLVASLAAAAEVPAQEPLPQRWGATVRKATAVATLRGLGTALWTAGTPGLTPAMGATAAYSKDSDPRPGLAALAAIGAAHNVLCLGMLWFADRARTGLAMQVRRDATILPWDQGAPPRLLLDAVAVTLAAALLAWAATRLVDRAVADRLHRLPPRLLPAAALAVLVALVLVLSGPWGLLVLVAGTAIGLLPVAVGVRRIHLVGAIVAPMLVSRWS